MTFLSLGGLPWLVADKTVVDLEASECSVIGGRCGKTVAHKAFGQAYDRRRCSYYYPGEAGSVQGVVNVFSA